MAIGRGQIRKCDQAGLVEQCENWLIDNRERIDAMRPDFAEWVRDGIAEVKRRVLDQEYVFSTQAYLRHVVSTMRRMESGEIAAVTHDGSGFTLAK